MAHRGLVAHGRPDGRYDLYRLAQCDPALYRADRLGLAHVIDPPEATAIATAITFEEVLGAHLDILLHETLYRLGDEPRSYRVLRFAVPTAGGVIGSPESRGAAGAGDPRGAIVAVHDLPDPEPDGYLRGWFEATREAVGELVDRGALDPGAATRELRDRLLLFAGEGVEVIVIE